jgi:DDE family transposase
MVPSITAILQRFTGQWAALLQREAILSVCGEIGYTARRDRVLTPVTTMQLFLLQILHGNTACRHLPHLSGLRFSAAAYCQARAKLPLRCFDRLLKRFGSAVQPCVSSEGRWHGHRTFFVDGSGCSIPDTPALWDTFGQPTGQRPGCGFPVARLLGLSPAGTGLLLKLVAAPLVTHDLAQVQVVHPTLQPGDVLVAERGLCSYAHLALLIQAGLHAVLCVGARQIVDVPPGRPCVMPSVRRTPVVKGFPRSRWLKTVGAHDQLVAWFKPKTRPAWLATQTLAALPDALMLREVRYYLGTPGFRTRQITLVTTLLDAAVYPVADLAELYRLRWQVETSLAHLKTTMRMDVLHGQTVPGVLKELTVFAIVYNLVRMVMWQSATLQHVGVERIGFLDALRWLSTPSTGMPLMALIVNPARPHRVEPPAAEPPWSARFHLRQRCLRLGQPEGHLHGPVESNRSGQLGAGLRLPS